MNTPNLTPDPRPEWITTAAEAIEEAAWPRIGRDLGTIHRDEIVAAGLRAVLPLIRAEIAEEIAREIEGLGPELACAWTKTEAASIAREHAGKGFHRDAQPSVVSTEGSGQRCPSRNAHESGSNHRCDLPAGHDGMHQLRLTRFFADTPEGDTTDVG